LIEYCLNKESFHTNSIHKKINKLLKKKKNIDIPSNPNEYTKFKKSEPILNVITF